MNHKQELSFLQSICQKYHLNTFLFTKDTLDFSPIDMKLREMLGLAAEYQNLYRFFTEAKPNRIYRIEDHFHCYYILFRLPDCPVPTAFSIGPFTLEEMNTSALTNYIEEYSIPPHIFKSLHNYFYLIPYIKDESMFLALLNSFGECIWERMEGFSYEFVEHDHKEPYYSLDIFLNSSPADYTPYDMQTIEQRYLRENELIKAVAHGHAHKAESFFRNNVISYLEQRTPDTVRNFKNYTIVLNTLLRKGAEVGMVHPYQIDRLSSDYARKIEQITSLETGNKLMHEMIRKYCLLVKNHSMKQYPSLIQKVIKHVDSDLTADLSLKSIAQELNVNPSYLSNQFKKITDSTLTDYVNQKRIEYALLLLNTTSLQIQTIAQYCGIPDVNYFTKIFKKIVQITPSEYRKKILGKL